MNAEPGKVLTVSVGETVIEEVEQTEYLWAELLSDIVAPGQGVILRKGAILWAREGEKKQFCDVDLPGQFCFTDEDGNGTLDKARVVSGSRIPNVSAKYKEVWKPEAEAKDSTGKKWQLVYLGAGGGILRFSAREYVNGTVLASDVSYDVPKGEPATLAFRGARIEVLNAGNEGIQYKVQEAAGR